jgi:hypothetical protein
VAYNYKLKNNKSKLFTKYESETQNVLFGNVVLAAFMSWSKYDVIPHNGDCSRESNERTSFFLNKIRYQKATSSSIGLLLLRHAAVYGPRRAHSFPVSPLVRVENLLPSNGRCLQNHYLAKGLPTCYNIYIYIFKEKHVCLFVFVFLHYICIFKQLLLLITNLVLW